MLPIALHRWRSHTATKLAALGVLVAAIFIVDTLTRLEIAVSVLYVAVVLLGTWVGPANCTVPLGMLCAALTLTSFGLTRAGDPGVGAANLGLSLGAIAATTYLSRRIELADRRMRDARGQLAHASRLVMLGELSAAMSHELNQPLTAIVANGNAAMRWQTTSPPDNAEVRLALDRIVRDAHRASTVLQRVRQLVGRKTATTITFRIDDLILETVELVEPELKRARVELSTQIAYPPPSTLADRTLLQQVIINLVLNAIHAMESLSDSRIRRLDIGADRIGRRLQISVADTGPGLTAPELNQIFEPFYTTRPNGLGLGLTICRSIIEAHGGTIAARSTPGSGTIILIEMPLAN